MGCVTVGYIVLVTVSVMNLVKGQFPRACVNSESLTKKECCPVPPGFKEACGKDGSRGDCGEIIVREWSATYDHFNIKHVLDDRHNWPKGVFERSCKCRANYAGYDCSKCKYGYHGKECNQRKVLIRKSFANLSPEEQDKFMMYMNMSRFVKSDYMLTTVFTQDIQETINNRSDPALLFRNVSIHEYFVWLHYYSTNRNTVLPDKTKMPFMDFGHRGQGFSTWHRLYLLAWERALQDLSGDENYTIPFWDWTVSAKCEICSDKLLGNVSSNGDVVGKYFAEWTTICYPGGTNVTDDTKLCDPSVSTGKLKRSPGQNKQFNGFHPAVFPTKKEVEFVLGFETFDLPPFSRESSCSFRNLLEGYANTTSGYRLAPGFSTVHNIVHIAIGGAMGTVEASSNDPIFLLHHCFVDRIFEKWLRKFQKDASALSATEAPIGHNRGDVIVPMFPVYTNEELFSESSSFGYDFEGVDKDGKSPDDGATESTSLGRCPDNARVADRGKSTEGCIEWKIAVGASAGVVFVLFIILIVSRYKRKNRVSAKCDPALST